MDNWKQSAKVQASAKVLQTPEMADLYWDGLGKLTKPELAKLCQKLAFAKGDGKVALPGQYPDPWFERAAKDTEPRVLTPSGRLKVYVPCDQPGGTGTPFVIVKKPTADQIAAGVRAQIK